MRGIDMAEPSRRRTGYLTGEIVQLLQRSQVPLTGIEIANRLRHDDPRVSNSLVFRALQQLRRDAVIRKIEHLNGYALGGETRTISLVCAECGKLFAIEEDAFFERLDDIARRQGFRPSRYVIEFAGTCGRCDAAAGCAPTSSPFA
ncbi:MAG: transcriptional repressor [Sphingomonas sp.]